MNEIFPLVSIIMPAYNAEKYIAEAIESVIKQTYSNWELLITDDGSTDETFNIISSFQDNRIHVTQQNNSGVSVARNKGLSLAKGKYITFLDADDLLPFHSLEHRLNHFKSHPEADIVDGKVIIKDRYMQNELRIYKPYYTGNILPRLLALDERVFFNVCYMFKKEILGNVKFTEQMTHAEDLLFYMELANQKPIQYNFISEPIYYYRSGHSSAMTNLDGLEQGYLILLSKINKLKKISLLENLMIHSRVIRILCLSRLKRKEFKLALHVLFIITTSYKNTSKYILYKSSTPKY